MVLHFSSIPTHLQVKIAEQMYFWDMRQFEISSKHSNYITNAAKHKVCLPVSMIDIGGSQPAFWIKRPKPKILRNIRKEWDEVIKALIISPLTVGTLRMSKFDSLESLDQLAQHFSFTNNKVTVLWWKQGEQAFEIFYKLWKLFNINALGPDTYYICNGKIQKSDPELIWLPEFLKLEYITMPVESLPDDRFLQFTAHAMMLQKLDSHPNVGPTLNKFFKQWFSKERKITKFNLDCDPKNESLSPEVLFADLPFTFCRSYEQRDTKVFSTIPDNELIHRVVTVYFIDRGDIKLFVSIGDKAKCMQNAYIAYDCTMVAYENVNEL